MRILSTAIIFLVVSLSRSVWANDAWKFFKLNETKEDSVVAVFGTPDVVNIQSSYENLRKAKESNGRIEFPSYALSYNRFRGDLNILKGPLGEAASTEVQIEAGVVVGVDWEYSVKYKDAAEAKWKKDKGFNTKPGKAITIGSKKLSDENILYVICTTGRNDTCDGPIKIMFSKDTASVSNK